MKLIRSIAQCVLIIMAIQGHVFAQATTQAIDHPPNGHNSPYRVSIHDIIINPGYYDRSPIQVVGYFRWEDKGFVLYSDAQDSKKPKNNRGIMLYLGGRYLKTAWKYDRHYILVEGKFYAKMFNQKGYCGSMLITKLSQVKF